ncbi:hypothetical protein [Methanobrevibacter sp.]
MVSKAVINPAMMIWAREYAGFIDEYECCRDTSKNITNYGKKAKNILLGIS